MSHNLRILYISCAWEGTSHENEIDWVNEGFAVASNLLNTREDLNYVWVGCSCIVGEEKDADLRARQLRHVPLALLRCDAMLALPLSTSPDGSSLLYTDLQEYSGSAWSRLELSLAQLGQATTYFAFRVHPLPTMVEELVPGKDTVRELAQRAVERLEAAATVPSVALKKVASENWLGGDGNPLSVLEVARDSISGAELTGSDNFLKYVGTALPIPASTAKDVRASLGRERRPGEKEIALSLLLYTAMGAQRKGRNSYTDCFINSAALAEVTYRPIAVVRSPYRERFGTPRQPQVTTGVLQGSALQGRIVFLKGHSYEEALRNLAGFDMIWVISHMHLNSSGWNTMVRPPRLPEERKGLFSTRSPHRPNPIALSSLRVIEVNTVEGVIHVEGLDLLDGTPVLDVKPYIGYCDSFPSARAGWLDELGEDHEDQGDFLQKFSIGAALVHTAGVAKESKEVGAGTA
ncbi:unnamed protein product [Choristocarpus tenellus]